MQYRRAQTPGATYFFTVVTYQRQKLFHHPETVALWHQMAIFRADETLEQVLEESRDLRSRQRGSESS